MTPGVTCLRGLVYRHPQEAYTVLEALEAEDGLRRSIYRCNIAGHFHLKLDNGASRDVACNTKRVLPSKSFAKKKLKEMRRAGRRELVIYPCWYSPSDDQHYHLGHPPGSQTYHRAGRIFG